MNHVHIPLYCSGRPFSKLEDFRDAMQAVNYRSLLDADRAGGGPLIRTRDGAELIEVYRDDRGVQYRSLHNAVPFFHEIVRLGEDAFLLATDCSGGADAVARQVVDQGDWIHFQFRLDGDGYESVPQSGLVKTPPKSCIVARYPKDSVIERRVIAHPRRRFVCLFMRPTAVATLLDACPSRFPDAARWLADDEDNRAAAMVMPLGARMTMAATEVLSCGYSGVARRGFLRARSIELIAAVLEALEAKASERSATQRLSAHDRARISLAHALLDDEDEGLWTLGGLARRVGLNRSTLAAGFKQVYGVPVRKFWREKNLNRARQLLETGEMSVTELALLAGYADTSSFTRAFSRHFGVAPSACKGG